MRKLVVFATVFILFGLFLDFRTNYGLVPAILGTITFLWGFSASMMFGTVVVMMSVAYNMKTLVSEIVTAFIGCLVLVFYVCTLANVSRYAMQPSIHAALNWGFCIGVTLVILTMIVLKNPPPEKQSRESNP